MTDRAVSVAEVPPEVANAPDDQPIMYPEVHETRDDPTTEAQKAIVAADGALEQPAPEKPKPPKPKKEKPAEEPVAADPDEGRVGSMALALRKREAAFITQKQAFAREKDEFTRYRTQTESELTNARALTNALRSDPVAVLRQIGFSDDDIAARLLNGGRARPEEALTAQSREVEAVKKELLALKAERENERKAALREREERIFVDQSRSDAERWPLSSKYSEARLKAKAWEIVNANNARGVRLTNEDLLDQIEEELTEIASLRGGAAPAAAPKPKPTPAARPARPTVERTPPAPTLTSRGAGVQTTDEDEDVDLPMLSDEERTAHLLRALAKSAQNGIATR